MTIEEVVKLQTRLRDSYQEYLEATKPEGLPMRIMAEAQRPYQYNHILVGSDASSLVGALVGYDIFPALTVHYKSLSWWGKRQFRKNFYRVFTGKAEFDGQWNVKKES